MQKLWTICLSLMMGISFVASYPAALVEAPAMKTPDESLEAIKAKAFMDPLDQLVQSFPDDFNTCTQPQETAQPSSSEPDASASEASSPDSSSQEAASSEPAEPAEASGDPSEPAIPANSDNAIEYPGNSIVPGAAGLHLPAVSGKAGQLRTGFSHDVPRKQL